MRIVVAWIILFASLRCALAANDGDTARARAHLATAVAFYDEGRYEDAAREMEAAYAIRKAPELKYNLAQCYERLGRYPLAIAAYRRYLDEKPAADDRASVEARIVNLDRRASNSVAQPATPPPPPTAAERVVLKTVVVYRDAPPRPGRGARVAAVAVAALGVVGLGAGVTLAVLARRNGCPRLSLRKATGHHR